MFCKFCQSTASWSPLLTCGGICIPPTITCLPYHISGTTFMAVGCFQLLARWPGTLSWILSGIQRAVQTVLCVYSKHTCSCDTSTSSAIGVLNDNVLYKSMHSSLWTLNFTLLLFCFLKIFVKLSYAETYVRPRIQWSKVIRQKLHSWVLLPLVATNAQVHQSPGVQGRWVIHNAFIWRYVTIG